MFKSLLLRTGMSICTLHNRKTRALERKVCFVRSGDSKNFWLGDIRTVYLCMSFMFNIYAIHCNNLIVFLYSAQLRSSVTLDLVQKMTFSAVSQKESESLIACLVKDTIPRLKDFWKRRNLVENCTFGRIQESACASLQRE